MRRVLSIVAGFTVVAATGVVALPTPASATGFTCTSTMTGTIPGTVFVPGDETCTLSFATVMGQVSIDPTGTLRVFNSTLNGSTVSGSRPAGLVIQNSTIKHSIVISELTPQNEYGENGFFSDAICGSDIGGSLTFTRSAPGSTFTVGTGFLAPGEGQEGGICSEGNTIEHSATFSGNNGRFQFGGNTVFHTVIASNNTGGGAIINNDIDKSLVCRTNNPAVTQSGNSVGGVTHC